MELQGVGSLFFSYNNLCIFLGKTHGHISLTVYATRISVKMFREPECTDTIKEKLFLSSCFRLCHNHRAEKDCVGKYMVSYDDQNVQVGFFGFCVLVLRLSTLFLKNHRMVGIKEE